MLRSDGTFLDAQGLPQQPLCARVVAARLGLLSRGHHRSYVIRRLHPGPL
jgi:hypothetical protein